MLTEASLAGYTLAEVRTTVAIEGCFDDGDFSVVTVACQKPLQLSLYRERLSSCLPNSIGVSIVQGRIRDGVWLQQRCRPRKIVELGRDFSQR